MGSGQVVPKLLLSLHAPHGGNRRRKERKKDMWAFSNMAHERKDTTIGCVPNHLKYKKRGRGGSKQVIIIFLDLKVSPCMSLRLSIDLSYLLAYQHVAVTTNVMLILVICKKMKKKEKKKVQRIFE
jgi:hypothetical protein